MAPISPRSQHLLDQYMALTLDVQARLASHKTALVASGWAEPEAWALCQSVEERILGPVMDMTSTALKIEEALEGLVDRLVAEELKKRSPDTSD